MAITQSQCTLGSPIIFAAAADKLDQNLFIREALWTGCSTAAHVLLISDYDSGVTLHKSIGVANRTERLHVFAVRDFVMELR